ncbi:hypothetical protein [uncultured Microbulbifer sp.]|uniref:hypothetical protein n=1 Tax=uncultured Microbulbifer sp. TaxID=348147 RepID=UPI00262A10F8|nr:hypothetical protein [uncultured Microbulbifer sp.]
MNYSINIEWMEGGVPDDLDWRSICPYFVIIFSWLYKKGCLSKIYYNDGLLKDSFMALSSGSMSLPDFVDTCFDGELTDDDILGKENREFFRDYTSISYSKDLEFFSLFQVYIELNWIIQSVKSSFR